MSTPKNGKNTTKAAAPAVVENKPTDLAVFEGYGEFAGRGFQNQTQEDISIPFINLLQAMSPEVSEIEGAKAGLFMNSVTQELMDEVEFVPAITQHVFMEWRPRAAGGGIVATHQIASDIVKAAKADSKEFGKYKHGENDLVETYYVFGILSKDGAPVGMAVLAFTSTKIKAYKQIMGRLNSFQIALGDGRRINPPLFAHLLKLTATKQRNAKGEFFVPVIQPAVENDVMKSLLQPDDPRFLMASECEKLVDSGRAQADMASQERTQRTEEDPDEKLPF